MGLKDVNKPSWGQRHIGTPVDNFWKQQAAKPKPRKPLFHNVKPAEAKNLFTGLRLKKSVTGAVLLGALAYTAIKAGKDVANTGRGNLTPTDVGEAPFMSYDTATLGRKDMGATGDIVFGMHRRR